MGSLGRKVNWQKLMERGMQERGAPCADFRYWRSVSTMLTATRHCMRLSHADAILSSLDFSSLLQVAFPQAVSAPRHIGASVLGLPAPRMSDIMPQAYLMVLSW